MRHVRAFLAAVAIAVGGGPEVASAAQPAPLAITVQNNTSGTVTTGGVWVVAVASSGTRLGCVIQNPPGQTEVLYVNVGSASPSLTNSFQLSPGAVFTCGQGVTVDTDAIKVTAATSGHPYVEIDQ